MIKLVEFSHESHPRLYARALHNDLRAVRVEGNAYTVPSKSEPGKLHLVHVYEDAYDCTCKSTSACFHGCEASSTHLPWLGDQWYAQRQVELARWQGECVLAAERVASHGNMKRFKSELRKVNRVYRAVSAGAAAGAVALPS